MFEMVDATDELIIVMSSTPKKLKTALMMMAGRILMLRVVTAVAIALGASVQPLTKMTPKVSKTVTAKMGFETTCATNCASETSNRVLPIQLHRNAPAGIPDTYVAILPFLNGFLMHLCRFISLT